MNREIEKMYPSYSIAIRTLGTAGEKYRKLLESIERQTIKPEKVVVVLPEGYKLPSEQLGCEEYYFSLKGMIPQRIAAIDYIDTKYVLFCDDDVELEPDFSKKLIECMELRGYSVASGPLLDFFPPDTWKYKLSSILGGACLMIRGKESYYTRILSTGGWSYNRSIDISERHIYQAESLAGTCFMANRAQLRDVEIGREMWAEKTGYSAFEDRIMIMKMLVNGHKSCVVSDAHYIHNDGKTSTRDIKLAPIYAGSFNHYVFWHRFLYKQSKNTFDKLWKKLCINYYVLMSRVYGWGLYLIKKKSADERNASVQGFKDAKDFIKSQEYLTLPEVVTSKKNEDD